MHGKPESTEDKKPSPSSFKIFFSALSFFLTIKALSGIPLYSFKALFFLGPLFTAILGVLFFGERLAKHHIVAFSLCLLGVFLAFSPKGETFSVYGFFALLSALCASAAVFVFKKMAKTETTPALILYYEIVCVLMSSFFVLIDFKSLPLKDGLIFLSVALCHLAASFLYTFGLRHQKLTNIAIANYSSLPLAIFLGLLIGDHLPTLWFLLASLLIVCGNALLFFKK